LSKTSIVLGETSIVFASVILVLPKKTKFLDTTNVGEAYFLGLMTVV
jgi:hypothetical protein